MFGDELPKTFPVLTESGSDTATFDNALQFLVVNGRSLPHAVLMMIPEAWQNNPKMDEDLRAFYEYHACLMEPWDGPASIVFTNGEQIGAVLDRNGLRPSRYYVTKDDVIIMASEVGVLPIKPEDVVKKWRLQPGKMFLCDLEQGRIIDDARDQAGPGREASVEEVGRGEPDPPRRPARRRRTCRCRTTTPCGSASTRSGTRSKT